MNNKELLFKLNEYLSYENGNLIWIKKSSKNTVVGSIAGHTRPSKYMTLKFDHEMYLLHRVVFFMHHGYFPKYVDHINGVRNDNRIENLRECTHSQNHQNKSLAKNNKSGYKGVSRAKGNKWRARIKKDGRGFHLGTFTTVDEAARAYNRKASEIFGEFAHLNKVESND